MNLLTNLKRDLKNLVDPQKANFLPRFFKTSPGQYGEGDIFIGVTVPKSRIIAKKYKDLSLLDIQKLLNSKIHEERLVALFILIDQFEKADTMLQTEIYKFYLSNTKHINNWDLVDSSAPYILGKHLYENKKEVHVLSQLAQSKSLWERRIAIIATHYFMTSSPFLRTGFPLKKDGISESNSSDELTLAVFLGSVIKQNDFEKALEISNILLNDKHDLIHKAVGWMLREIGNKDREIEETFLKKHYQNMPRTMLRYAIEKFSDNLRKKYLKGKI